MPITGVCQPILHKVANIIPTNEPGIRAARLGSLGHRIMVAITITPNGKYIG
jgi:hypothetical protein